MTPGRHDVEQEAGKLSMSQNAKERPRLLEEAERTVSRAIISQASLTEEMKMAIKRNFCFPLGFELTVGGEEGKVALLFGSFIGGLACAEVVGASLPLGPRAAHMTAHIVLINAVAPALARAWLCFGAVREQAIGAPRTLFGAAAAQLALLWIWHAPGAIAFSSSHLVAHAVISAVLLGASLIFWLVIFGEPGRARWRGIFGLLATGKLSCLLGALLLFSPRILNVDDSLGLRATDPEAALLDQRLAGLLMLAACPVCYVLSAIKIAADWLRELERYGSRPLGCASIRPPIS